MIQALSLWAGPAIAVIFVVAYLFVFAEEKLKLRKFMPVMFAASLIWILVAIRFHAEGRGPEAAEKIRHVALEYTELFLFLLSAMSFVNTMVERNVFEALRTKLTSANLSIRGIYWITGLCAFLISPVADNMTTALVMGMVVLASLSDNKKAVAAALLNIVVAANAGGVFSPFGDITTLMIWQKGTVDFIHFFNLFIPALINWLLPALIINFTLPQKKATPSKENARVYRGGFVVVGLFLATVATTVFLDHTLDIPPFVGMMMGLGALNIYGYSSNRFQAKLDAQASPHDRRASDKPLDIFNSIEKVEWDTLLFFYGIMLCVGGLDAVGYLHTLSQALYASMGQTATNVAIGFLSSVVGSVPVTYAVLVMNPVMHLGQWLLLTLTTGVGGSILSIGSAAGVALMGISKGSYTFMSHLKWAWAILLGYAASIGAHILFNDYTF